MSTEVAGVLRAAARTRGRRILLIVTMLFGALAAGLLVVGLPAGERTFATFAENVQSFISVPLPFVGVLLAHDLRRTPRAAALPMLVGATVIAVAAGLVGGVLSVAALAASGSTAADPWAGAGFILVGGVLVQVLAQLVGTGLGLLIGGRPVWACLSTIAVPLSVYALLTPAGTARAWLTPFGSLQEVFDGPAGVANWAVAALTWGVGLNLVGVTLLRRQADKASGQAPTPLG
ncbi:hypothetical protein [Actinoplanes sp. NPDC051859]|uniref:hypothetical protein n=1 Tax=Actinoplanes sp. NPDC051859 TaxID=3363909 RepID=UPI0037B56C8B